MAEIKYNDIQNIDESWENYAGSSVERFIKKQLNNKAGYIYRSQSKEGDYYYLYGFTDYEQFEDWAGGDSSIRPLFRVQLPNIENDTFSVNLTTNSNTNKIVNLGEGVIVSLRYTSVSTNPTTGVTQDTYNDGTLIIQRSANGSAFIEVGRVVVQPTPHNEVTFKNFDLTPYLVDGDNKIRMRVEDNVNGSVSANITFQSVVNTTLAIENSTSTAEPLRALQFQYYIQGQVAKTLYIRITQGQVSEEYQFVIGENTYIEVPYTTPLINLAVQSGIIEVDSWLSVDDTELTSYHSVSQFYYTDGTSANTIIILNNVSEDVVNYTNQHLFDMTLYNQGADVTVRIQSMDGETDYQTLTFNNCQTGIVYPVFTTLEIESVADSFNLMVSVSSANFICTPYSITVDNSEKMSPVDGASFVLNPKLRNNSETNPNTIINTISGNTVSSTFTGFSFINDGWLADSNNIGVLRIPSEHSLTINYDVFNNLTYGTSIEIDYKVYNVFNDADEVVKMYTTSDDKPLGFVMNATEAAFYTSENQTKRDQDVIFQEGVRTHLVVNIIPNLANSGLNYIRIFINGILNREMLYSGTDVFKNGTCNMVFGSQNCDIDIYCIRVYKTGLSASDIRQNYMSSLPDIESKTAFKAANDILSADGTISYEKARLKYNTLIWTGQVPSYSTGNREYQGSLQVNILGDNAHSGNITGLKIKGQGSSSRGYWKWNHQYDWNKIDGVSTKWTDGNGTEHTDGYSLTDTDPAATKLVAKLNWASSMQSHKIGSTALYTDLWKSIVGGNSITNTPGFENARVTVNEKPFLYFVKSSANSQPVFYGLMTFGSGKYDKPTFGYDKNVFPDYLILEGSDNGLPLTLRQVPWFDDEVTYNDEEEYYEYAGQGNLDFGMGKQENITYFKDAFNFTYLHSPFLVPFTGTISQDADKKNQYWDTSTKNVYRYDYISQEWVDAGTTKTNGEYDVLNLETQTGLSRSSYSSDSEFTNAVISWRKTDFKNRISTYYNTTDVLFSMAFLKLIGASDNWCKNTYEYLDPVTFKICLAQDDMDTLMLTDNVGRKTKPYYVEEFDLDDENKPYFNGSDNVFFNLMVMSFESEEKAMMKQILTTMVNLHNSVMECIDHYFFSVQKYFPAVAFNETARLLYEQASVQQSNGSYVNGTPAISQSLGDQLQGEMQWWNRRIPYMQSWSSTDPFYTRSTTEPNLQFRSMTTTTGSNPEYSFSLTPWQWLYPKVGTGQYLSYDATRVQAGNVYNTVTMSTDGNTDTFIYGSNYYTSYGEFGGVSLSETFNLVGDRLLEFSADSREVSRYDFRPSRMTVTCPELRTLCVYGCSTLSGVLNLSGCTKLTSVDLTGTSLTSVVLPESDKLLTANLPAVTSLTVVNTPNLHNFSITSYNNLINITTDDSAIALDVLENADNLGSITLYNIEIDTTGEDCQSIYNILVDPEVYCNITGHIYLDMEITQEEKNSLEAKFGSSIWSSSSDFYITFIPVDIETVSLTASKTILANNDSCTLSVSFSGNNDESFDWSISGNIGTSDVTTVESKTQLTINTGILTSAANITVTYTINKTNGQTVSGSMVITLLPYQFYIDDYEIDEYSEYIYYGSGDSSVTKTVSAEITCSDSEKTFTINSITSDNGSATFSGTTITSFELTDLGNGYSIFTVSITVDSLTISYDFYVYDEEVSISINSIPDINALNGSGSGDATFTYLSDYASVLSVVSASVSGGNTNTISNLTLNGCTISCSGYTTTGTRTLTLTYKVNNGADCTTTMTFTVNYVAIGATIIAEYDKSSFQTLGDWFALDNVFTSSTNYSGWPTDSNSNYVEQDSCSVSFGGNTYNLTWGNISGYGACYYYVYNQSTAIILSPSISTGVRLQLIDSFYDGTSDVTLTLTLIGTSNLNNFYYTWYQNTSLKNIEIQNAKTIGNSNVGMYGYTFYGCSNLLTAKFDSYTKNIASYSFYNCSSLTQITCLATSAPSISSDTFNRINTDGTLVYPSGSNYSNWLKLTSSYLGYSKWNNFTVDNMKYRDNGDHTVTLFGYTNQLSGSVTVPSTVQYNGITYPVTAVYYGAFKDCSSLTSITLQNNITYISGRTFYNCSNLESVVIPSTVETIDAEAFSSCTKLSTITISRSSAPTLNYSNCFGKDNYTAGSNSGTTNVLYVPSDATGYDGSNWTAYLLNASYGNFTVSKTL